jgi:hypothetical protein
VLELEDSREDERWGLLEFDVVFLEFEEDFKAFPAALDSADFAELLEGLADVSEVVEEVDLALAGDLLLFLKFLAPSFEFPAASFDFDLVSREVALVCLASVAELFALSLAASE